MTSVQTTIDRAGRIVIPKPLREALGLAAGQLLDILIDDGRLMVEVVPTPMSLNRRGKGAVAIPEADLPTLTAELVRAALERSRR